MAVAQGDFRFSWCARGFSERALSRFGEAWLQNGEEKLRPWHVALQNEGGVLMAGTVWSKFFWQDWRSDAGLRQCSLAARGLWMDMLCVAAQHDPIGLVAVNGEGLSVEGIARQAGADPREVAILVSELERNDVFARDSKGIIYSRRMKRDARFMAESRRYGKRGGNPTLKPQDNPKLADS